MTDYYEYYQPGEQFSRRRRIYGLHYPNIPRDSSSPIARLAELRHKFKPYDIEYIQSPIDSTSYRMSVLIMFNAPVSVSSCVYFKSGEYIPSILKKSMSAVKYGIWLGASISNNGFTYNEGEQQRQVIYQSTITYYPESDITYGHLTREELGAKMDHNNEDCKDESDNSDRLESYVNEDCKDESDNSDRLELTINRESEPTVITIIDIPIDLNLSPLRCSESNEGTSIGSIDL